MADSRRRPVAEREGRANSAASDGRLESAASDTQSDIDSIQSDSESEVRPDSASSYIESAKEERRALILGVVTVSIVLLAGGCAGFLAVLYQVALDNPQTPDLRVAVGSELAGCTADICNWRGQCFPLRNEKLFCQCDPGFSGSHCEINLDDCKVSPCTTGTCVDGTNDFSCNCEPGYTGKRCDTAYSTCDITSLPCSGHGDCVDIPNSYICQCHPGYTDTYCDVDINECASSPCIYGECQDLVDDFYCACQPGYTGKVCGEDINECETMIPNGEAAICTNGATCLDIVDDYLCQCTEGFQGRTCDTVLLPCALRKDPPVCENGGVCEVCEGPTETCDKNYRCNCVDPYTGYNCQTPPDPIDGGWSEWVSTGIGPHISHSSGQGTCDYQAESFTRACNSPAPDWGGAGCEGEDTKNVPQTMEDCTCNSDNTVTIGEKECSCSAAFCTDPVNNAECCDTIPPVG